MLFWDAETDVVCKAQVHINDPFLLQLTVWTVSDDNEVPDQSTARCIVYDLLRNRAAEVEEPCIFDVELEEVPEPNPEPPQPKKSKTIKAEEPEIDMCTLIQCGDEETVPLKYVPCVNGILSNGAVTVYKEQDYRVDQLVFDGRRKKAFALLASTADEDVTMRLPAVRLYLKSDNFMKEEVFDFSEIDQHPVNQAFATFSTIKRAVGLSMKNTQSWTIGPATTTVRRFTGFTGSGHKDIARFSSSIGDGTHGCPRSWDSFLGHRWDVLLGLPERLDTVVKLMRFTEHRDFGMFTIRCTINTCEGRYRNENSYRSLNIFNSMDLS